tara:strand:- start:68 stop:301 length:234 start_codon:yes stop_codon:yes gene_type:complete
MEYRKTKYSYKEWGEFRCNDVELLKDVDTTSFGTKTLKEMHERIDQYLNSREFNQDLKEANKAAAIEFYKLSNTPKD